jgi:UDP-GlcNAc:undecaprenyl-phosphate GlcNAc-1-phosphate transferase
VTPQAYALIFLGSVFLSIFFVSLARALAYKHNFVDAPDGNRKLQASAIPKIGGAGLILTFSSVLMTATWLNRDIRLVPLLGVLVPALAVAFVGLVDDFKPLSPWTRLFFQTVAILALWYSGIGISIFENTAINFLATLIWILTILNALNLIDNSDGLAAGVTLISAIGMTLVAVLFDQYLVASLSLALSGVAVGFLRFNWNPASIYLGDAGSYFFGFLLAVLAIELEPVKADLVWGVLIPLLLLLFPIIDLFFVVLRRTLEGRHLFTPGRDHLSHELISHDFSVRKAVSVIYLFQFSSVLLVVFLVTKI